MERELAVERTRAGLEVARQLGRKPPQDDRQQGRVSQEAAGKRRPPQGRGQEPRRVHSDALPLGACLCARLACFKFRFLRRPLEEVWSLPFTAHD